MAASGAAVGAIQANQAEEDRLASVMSTVPRICGEHTAEQDLENTNPNFSEKSFEWSYNCQRCVSAYEARRRGYDVTVKPAVRGYDDISYVHPVETGIFSPYNGANPIDVSANSGTQAELNIDELMKTWGDGARAIVCVQWKPECGRGGHAFIAERINGKTIYVDPQTGKTGVKVKEYFMSAKGTGAWCGRIDNLPFTERIHECCKAREGL